jgi:hypothetical protein
MGQKGIGFAQKNDEGERQARRSTNRFDRGATGDVPSHFNRRV